MGHSSVVKVGKSLVMSMVGKSTRSAKVLKNSVAKVFDSRALDRLADHLLAKSTALAVLDDRVSSKCRSILSCHSKWPFRNPQRKEETGTKEELKVENGSNEEALIPPPEGSVNSLGNQNQNELISSSTLAELVPPCSLHATKEENEDDDDDDDGVWKERGDYSSCSEEEFKEMVDRFIKRFNQQIANEYYSTHHSHPHSQEIVFVRTPQHSRVSLV